MHDGQRTATQRNGQDHGAGGQPRPYAGAHRGTRGAQPRSGYGGGETVRPHGQGNREAEGDGMELDQMARRHAVRRALIGHSDDYLASPQTRALINSPSDEPWPPTRGGLVIFRL